MAPYHTSLVPAKAVTQSLADQRMPAFAGMSGREYP
jgi:hypothetical protein